MAKLIFFLLLVVVALLVLKSIGRASARKGEAENEPGHGPAERMVRCAHCGVNLPQSESLAADGKYFCCEEHRRLAR